MVVAGGHASSEMLARFKVEAEAVARLQHPNVVQVFEVGEHEGNPFFSLDFVDGGSLDNRLNGTLDRWLPGGCLMLMAAVIRRWRVNKILSEAERRKDSQP
jgi:serine/threonine protein kinase